MSSLNPKSGPGAPAWIAIIVLGLVAAGLVVFALRSDPVPNAGERPSVVVTPSPSDVSRPATPAPQPSSITPQASTTKIIMGTSSVGVRSSSEPCEQGDPPVIEVSSDGGASWSPAPIEPDAAVFEVLGGQVVGEDQIDLVVRTGPQCALNVLTSYTGGQFWQLYPERISEQSFVDRLSPSTVTIKGRQVPSPCSAPLQIVDSGAEPVVRCVEGLFGYSADSATWHVIAPIDSQSVAVSGSVAFAANTGVQGCDGVSLQKIALDGTSVQGEPLACVRADQPQPSVSITAVGSELWLWSDDSIVVSGDQGETWN
ncbi:hypothetical protein ACEXQE_16830 [Herbiconiux sp. P17]|uniref:hypothetical protein n=1 Tax=Herbiconiux wuyangfengii TaxID=3342794 RepID=UPI0035B972F9